MKTTIVFLMLLVGITSCNRVKKITQTNNPVSSTVKFSWEYIETNENVEFVVSIKDYNPDIEKVLYVIQPDTVYSHPLKDCEILQGTKIRKNLEKGVRYNVAIHVYQGDSLTDSVSTSAEFP